MVLMNRSNHSAVLFVLFSFCMECQVRIDKKKKKKKKYKKKKIHLNTHFSISFRSEQSMGNISTI